LDNPDSRENPEKGGILENRRVPHLSRKLPDQRIRDGGVAVLPRKNPPKMLGPAIAALPFLSPRVRQAHFSKAQHGKEKPKIMNVAVARPEESKIVGTFIVRLEELLDALSEVFPECKKVEKTLKDFRNVIKPYPSMHDMVIKQWHAEVSPHYDAIRLRDVEKLLAAEIGIFKKLDIVAKWRDNGFDESSRKILFDYLDQLNYHSQIHAAVPKDMMTKIEQTAMDIVNDMQSGNFNPQTFSLQSLTQNLMSGLTEKDLEQFAANLPNLQGTITSVIQGNMGQLQQLGLGNLLGQALQQGGMDNLLGGNGDDEKREP